MISDTIMIKCIKLENFIKKYKINDIDILKIDTEGHELQVMKGFGKYIKNIKCILIEFHISNIYVNYDSKKIHSYLVKIILILKENLNFHLLHGKIEFILTQNINEYSRISGKRNSKRIRCSRF